MPHAAPAAAVLFTLASHMPQARFHYHHHHMSCSPAPPNPTTTFVSSSRKSSSTPISNPVSTRSAACPCPADLAGNFVGRRESGMGKLAVPAHLSPAVLSATPTAAYSGLRHDCSMCKCNARSGRDGGSCIAC
jgi:hypothetical protein